MEENNIDFTSFCSAEIRSKLVELAGQEMADGLSDVDHSLYQLMHENTEGSKSFWTTRLHSDYHLSAEGFSEDKGYKDAKPEVQVKKIRQLYLNISKCLVAVNNALVKMETNKDVVFGSLHMIISQYNIPKALHRYIVWKPSGQLPFDFELLTKDQIGTVTGKSRSSEEEGVAMLCDVWAWKNTAPDWFPDPAKEGLAFVINKFIYSGCSVQIGPKKKV